MDLGFTTRAIRAATRVPRTLDAARATSAAASEAAAPTPATV